MPCRDYEDSDRWANDDLRNQNDKLARIACSVLTAFIDADPIASAEFLENNEEADHWWDKHQKADADAKAERDRKIKEQTLKQNALAKLTSEEKKALGL